MASEPYVEIFIDALSFLLLEDASFSLYVELVQRDEGTATDAEALERAMRATVEQHWKSGVNLDLDSCHLKVNAYVLQTKDGAVDPMAEFKNDLAELQDCKVVPVSGRGGLVRARDERLAASIDDKACKFILVASMITPGLLFRKTDHDKEVMQHLPGYAPLNASNQRVDTAILSEQWTVVFEQKGDERSSRYALAKGIRERMERIERRKMERRKEKIQRAVERKRRCEDERDNLSMSTMEEEPVEQGRSPVERRKVTWIKKFFWWR
ncbi:hypothetical protein J4E91_005346 [Alternaria rosae]|nr:hypothetical protein J4E91_005346 [Alternaria rosae]